MIVRDKNNETTTTPQVGPGKYDSDPTSKFRKTSHNRGSVPFGISNERFKADLQT